MWETLCGWVPSFDGWAIADCVCIAGQKRLMADPARLGRVETWTRADHLWTRRAALVITLPWARMRRPGPHDLAVQDRVLGWGAGYADDPAWFIQKAVAWWLRELSRNAPERTRAFLDDHGARLKPFTRREAARHLKA